MSGAGGDGGNETETEDDGGEDHMEEQARKKKRGRPPKARAEGDEKKRGGKWVVWYDEDGNEVDRKVKVGCCVAVARLSAVVQRSDFTTRLAIQLRLRSLARAVDFMHR